MRKKSCILNYLRTTLIIGIGLAVASFVEISDLQAMGDRNASKESLELPIRKIPNIPPSGEAYYAPDSLHVIAQTNDVDAIPAENGRSGNLTYTRTSGALRCAASQSVLTTASEFKSGMSLIYQIIEFTRQDEY